MKQTEAYQRLVEKGIRPSLQRIAIMDWLIKHPTHPTIEDVYKGLAESIPTLSKTTVYNTLRMLSEHNAAQMITIDEHHDDDKADNPVRSRKHIEISLFHRLEARIVQKRPLGRAGRMQDRKSTR